MLLSIQELTLECLSIFIDNFSGPRNLIILKSPLIEKVRMRIFGMALLISIEKCPLVCGLGIFMLPNLFSKSVGQISCPFALIFEAMLKRDELACSFGLLIIEVPLVIPVVDTNKSSLSMRNTINKVAMIIASVWIDKLAKSVGHIV